MPTYSFGEESPIKFEIPDKMAQYYNEAVSEFFKAQRRFLQKFGREWDPKADPIWIDWTHKQKKAWNQFAKVFNDVVKAEGPFHENDIMDDFLVRNVTQLVSEGSKVFGRALTLAVAGGVLYGLLNRRAGHV